MMVVEVGGFWSLYLCVVGVCFISMNIWYRCVFEFVSGMFKNGYSVIYYNVV